MNGKRIQLENGNSVFLAKKEGGFYVMFESSDCDGRDTFRTVKEGDRTKTYISMTAAAMRALAILYIEAEEVKDAEVQNVL